MKKEKRVNKNVSKLFLLIFGGILFSFVSLAQDEVPIKIYINCPLEPFTSSTLNLSKEKKTFTLYYNYNNDVLTPIEEYTNSLAQRFISALLDQKAYVAEDSLCVTIFIDDKFVREYITTSKIKETSLLNVSEDLPDAIFEGLIFK